VFRHHYFDLYLTNLWVFGPGLWVRGGYHQHWSLFLLLQVNSMKGEELKGRRGAEEQCEHTVKSLKGDEQQVDDGSSLALDADFFMVKE